MLYKNKAVFVDIDGTLSFTSNIKSAARIFFRAGDKDVVKTQQLFAGLVNRVSADIVQQSWEFFEPKLDDIGCKLFTAPMGSICITSPRPEATAALHLLRQNFGSVFALTSGEYNFQFSVLKTNKMLGYFDEILTPTSDFPKELFSGFSNYFLIDDKSPCSVNVKEKLKFLGVDDVPNSSMYASKDLTHFNRLTFLQVEEYTQDHVLEKLQLSANFAESIVNMIAIG